MDEGSTAESSTAGTSPAEGGPAGVPAEGGLPEARLRASALPSGGLPGAGPAGRAFPAGRPLRKDAERNRQRILQAAADVFTAHGLEATLDDVAHHAGVGVGTVYRRFPNKEALAEALFHERLDGLVALAEQALTRSDAWQSLVWFLEQAGALLATDRGMRQVLMFATYGRDRVSEARSRMLPVVSQLVQRAQQQGKLRADLSPTDIPVIEFMLGTAAEYAQHSRPEIWRRYLALIVDGLRADPAGTTALPEPALRPEEVEQAMRRGAAAHERPARLRPARRR
ncbi:MAG TPA: TetR/AcrR family transcriptional regulator [Streptosporangiaceae bacterium]|jgi:AcrR family transcriptional regulator